MVTLEQLVTRAQDELGADFKNGLVDHVVNRETVEFIVKSAVHGLGFHISESTGEVCDPRPKPVVEFQYSRPRRRYRR